MGAEGKRNIRTVLLAYGAIEDSPDLQELLFDASSAVCKLQNALKACIAAHETGQFEPAQAAYEAAKNLIDDLDEDWHPPSKEGDHG